jgi:hypothetical protein
MKSEKAMFEVMEAQRPSPRTFSMSVVDFCYQHSRLNHKLNIEIPQR